MKPVQMDRMDFSDHFSYINLFILSYRLFSMVFLKFVIFSGISCIRIIPVIKLLITSAVCHDDVSGQRGRPGQT